MDINAIQQYACDFRNALEFVSARGQYGWLRMFAHFPRECCRYSSDLLAEYLIDMGIARECIQHVNGETKREGYTHCWLLIDNRYYLDITADQFNGKTYFAAYTPIEKCCVVERDTHFYELFDKSKTTYTYNVGIASYGGDIPHKLRIVYEAAIKQIECRL